MRGVKGSWGWEKLHLWNLRWVTVKWASGSEGGQSVIFDFTEESFGIASGFEGFKQYVGGLVEIREVR